MKKIPYTRKFASGRTNTFWSFSCSEKEQQDLADRAIGFCLSCGSENEVVEKLEYDVECSECQKPDVFGVFALQDIEFLEIEDEDAEI